MKPFPRSECTVTILLFEDFELLDAFGPAEIFSRTEGMTTKAVAPVSGLVRSSQGVAVEAPASWDEAGASDMLLVPGGLGTRSLVSDSRFLEGLAALARRHEVVASVCTGAALLAEAGLLNGYRATSNKRVFDWVSGLGSGAVDWIAEARWVEDRDRWSSSGIAAGMDMAAALAGRYVGQDAAQAATDRIEYEPVTDSRHDPFARKNGLLD